MERVLQALDELDDLIVMLLRSAERLLAGRARIWQVPEARRDGGLDARVARRLPISHQQPRD
jgi:hypothetical protein